MDSFVECSIIVYGHHSELSDVGTRHKVCCAFTTKLRPSCRRKIMTQKKEVQLLLFFTKPNSPFV